MTKAKNDARQNRPDSQGNQQGSSKTVKRKRQVLIVENDPDRRASLEQVVWGIKDETFVVSFDSSLLALDWLDNHRPDLVIIEYHLPKINGVEFIGYMQKRPDLESVPIVMVGTESDIGSRYQALDAGATVFLAQPIDQIECRATCRNLLRLREQQTIIQDRAHVLENQVDIAIRQVADGERETLVRLGRAGEYRDSDTGNHVIRMARYARVIAESMGLDAQQCDEIEYAAPMHDIGKIGIPDIVLRKPGRYNDQEWMQMRQHTIIGHRILSNSQSRYIQLGAVIALNHHEKFDGTGYPKGLAGEEIPLSARIVAVADVFDALLSARPYKRPWTLQTALLYLREQAGGHFDPNCIEAFFEELDSIRNIYNELRDT